ncbi:MAG TPA: hypothetical protein VGL61_15830 [Kofleriaceae bacterium]
MRASIFCLLLACGSHAPAPAPAKTPAATAGSDAECGSSFDDFHEIDVYCRHVHDRCCESDGQWGCNNAHYVDWYGAYCRK